jgi:hypothetical protein
LNVFFFFFLSEIPNWIPKNPSETILEDDEQCPRNGFVGRTRKPAVSTWRHIGQRKEKGFLVEVNDQLIAVFKVQNKIYAVQDSCPHAGTYGQIKKKCN